MGGSRKSKKGTVNFKRRHRSICGITPTETKSSEGESGLHFGDCSCRYSQGRLGETQTEVLPHYCIMDGVNRCHHSLKDLHTPTNMEARAFIEKFLEPLCLLQMLLVFQEEKIFQAHNQIFPAPYLCSEVKLTFKHNLLL